MTRDELWAQGPLEPGLLVGAISPQLSAEFKQTPGAPTNHAVLWGVLGLVIGGFGGLIIGGAVGSGRDTLSALGVALTLGVLGAGVFGFIAWMTFTAQFGTALRLWAFARANDMTFVGRQNGQYNGMLFGVGSGRTHSKVMRANSRRPVEFGNYQYTTGSGKSQQTHRWGYVAVRLDNFLPNIVLDAEGNNGFFGSNLPVRFDKDQHLSLEGDFDRYFRLYCPSGYERDALYLFTPDVMVRFIDNAAELDVEIVDDWVYFYAKRDLVTLEPRMWAWLYSVLAAFLAKVDQWERWRDDRLRLEAQNYQNPAAPFTQAGTAVPLAGSSAAPLGGAPLGGEQADLVQAPPGASMGMTMAQAANVAPTGSRPPNPYLGPKGVAPGGRRLRRGVNWWSVIVIVAAFGLFLLQLLSRY